MSDTIDDFRNFYQPSRNKAPFDVAEAIRSTLAIMQTQWDKNSIDISLEGRSFTVEGYANEFQQAVLNILSNAKDAIVARQKEDAHFTRQIVIRLEPNRITLHNNGGKADPAVLERMFEPYFTTKFEDKGTGIGLYMTRTIIEGNMHGQIVAANQDDGVTFTITFQGEKP